MQIQDIADSVVSLWVALLEGLLEIRLSEIIRDPKTAIFRLSRIRNAQIVIVTLETLVLKIQLPHITPTNIVDGDRETLENLSDIFWQLYLQLNRENDKQSESGSPIRHLPIDQAVDHSLGNFEPFDSPSQSTIPIHSSRNVDTSGSSKPEISSDSSLKLPNNNTRFNVVYLIKSPERTFKTPVSIRISQSDTPHMRALKIRQQQALRQKAEYGKVGLASAMIRNLAKEKERHQRMTIKGGIRHKAVSQPTIQSDTSTSLGIPTISSDSMQSQQPVYIPEQNLASYMASASRAVPILSEFSEQEYERAWKEQIQIWKSALDDRIWTQKVALQQQMDSITNHNPLDQFAETQRIDSILVFLVYQGAEEEVCCRAEAV